MSPGSCALAMCIGMNTGPVGSGKGMKLLGGDLGRDLEALPPEGLCRGSRLQKSLKQNYYLFIREKEGFCVRV